ncbi:hypothetical protein [Pseudarthrobacter sp. H2]|uniref:hypothetical protein n=1 Tax=Pseudarthrobacter sp. H2 TaxID=3418415 RepID=UPI003CE69DC0
MPAPALSRTLVAEGAPRGGLAALCITQTTDRTAYAMAAATGTATLIAAARLARGHHAG